MSNKWSITNILKFLEDPEYPSIGPHLKLLGFIRLWLPDRKSKIGRLRHLSFYVTTSFFFSQYIKCFMNFNTSSLKLILQFAPFHVGILKACYLQEDYKNWQRLIGYLSLVERGQLAKNDQAQNEIIQTYITRNRRVTYFFWALAFFSNLSIFSEPYQKNQINVNGTSIYLNLFDGYNPFGREPPGYYISMSIQTVLGNIASAYIVSWDTFVVSIMMFFAGQLKITCLYCKMMIDATDLNKSYRNIAECHRFHTTLVETSTSWAMGAGLLFLCARYKGTLFWDEKSYRNKSSLRLFLDSWYMYFFNSLISPVMFVYLVNISINLGVNIIQIVEMHDDLPALMSSIIFMNGCMIQLLLFCWYAKEVTVESTFVSYSTFESNWPAVNKKLQREVALLGLSTNKILIFKAGPFHDMSLTTFISILRASYSFYTLLNTTS